MQDRDPELGELVLRCLLRKNFDEDGAVLIVIGAALTTTPLPPGDYSLTLHLTPRLMGMRYVREEHFLTVPDGMIPLGMGADDILTSDINLSPEAIRQFTTKEPA